MSGLSNKWVLSKKCVSTNMKYQSIDIQRAHGCLKGKSSRYIQRVKSLLLASMSTFVLDIKGYKASRTSWRQMGTCSSLVGGIKYPPPSVYVIRYNIPLLRASLSSFVLDVRGYNVSRTSWRQSGNIQMIGKRYKVSPCSVHAIRYNIPLPRAYLSSFVLDVRGYKVSRTSRRQLGNI